MSESMVNEFFRVACNIRSLRAAMRQLPIEQQQKIQENINEVYAAHFAQAQAEAAKEAEKVAKRDALLNRVNELLAGEGMTLQDLAPVIAPVEPSGSGDDKPRKTRAPKYQWVENGEQKTWSGQGKTPRFLVGKNRDEYLINRVAN